MKNKFKILYIFLGVTLFFIACTPKENELGGLIEKSALKYTITQDSIDPNMVILKSSNPGLTPQWITPLGNSTRVDDTVKLAFPGIYKFVYGIESDGGFVQADTFTVNITTTNLNYVSDEFWINLTGGPSHSKSWVLDLDADGHSKVFNGPVYFGGWEAAWYDWIMPKGFYGTMTFDLLNNGAHFSSNNLMIPSLSGTGTFMLYTNTMLLNTYGPGEILHDNTGRASSVPNWTTGIVVKTLTDTKLQLLVLDNDGSTQLIYNYVSKEYYDSL